MKTIDFIIEEIRRINPKAAGYLSADTPLIGNTALLDSMGLVTLCLALEDRADDEDAEFDWSSEKAMSRSSSIFKNVATLANEFDTQCL